VTRIYTNVPSIIAQANLSNSMSALETSLQRLSTGFRINSGKDDPAGLIASEVLRSEIKGIQQGITNTERANMMIATADSAMNEISNLLNDIRGLISEAANTGAMSDAMIDANQMQVDASLEAIDRIASSTTFMGKKLLDGSMDFTTDGVDRYSIANLAINKATFGAAENPITINLQVRQAAERAELYYNHAVAMEDITLEVKGSNGGSPFQFAKGTTVKEMAEAINLESDSTGVRAELGQSATRGSMQISSVGEDNDILITAGTEGAQAGFVEIKYTVGNEKGVYVEYKESLGPGYPATLNVHLQTEAAKQSAATGIDSDTLYNNNALDFTANVPGNAYNNTSINYVDGNLTDVAFQTANNQSGTTGSPYAYYSDVAVQAKALIGNINGMTAFANSATGYIQLTAKQAGSSMNDVTIQFIDAAGVIPSGDKALAQFVDNTENPGKKVLNVYVDATGGTTTFDDIIAAINTEGTFQGELGGDATMGAATIAVADCHVVGNVAGIQGNTNFSGGDAGTLFVVAQTETSKSAYPGIPDIPATQASYVYGDAANGGLKIEAASAQAADGVAGNGYTIVFDDTVGGVTPSVTVIGKEIKIAADFSNNPIAWADITNAVQTALGTDWTVTELGSGQLTSLGTTPTSLWTSQTSGVDETSAHTAGQIAAIFDLSNSASHGSERAAALFSVKASIDNDGTGTMTSKQFQKALSGGVDGGNIVTTAQEVVCALNNDKLWNSYVTQETLAGLLDGSIEPQYNEGTPIVEARLAPGNNGKGIVTAFEEVAYYGDVYDGTGIQFLGLEGSPNIRFVANPGESLSVERESLPDKLDYSQAILHSTNPNANVVIAAKNKGEAYDDITFRIKHAQPETASTQHAEGWAEYDDGISAAEALVTFYDVNGDFIPNSAFYITANERGDEFNNVSVNIARNINQQEKIAVTYNESKKILEVSLKDPSTTSVNEIIAAINAAGEDGKSKSGFTASLAYGTNAAGADETARDNYNSGSGTLGAIGLATKSPITVGNTGDTGGHEGTVTIYAIDRDVDAVAGNDPPDANQLVEIVNADDIVGRMFSARNYSTGKDAGTGRLEFTKDTNFESSGGVVEQGVIVVHLATDENGLVQTTARDLVECWDSLPPELTLGISASLLREPGANWDICTDTDGQGILSPTYSETNCDVTTYYDLAFQGWGDNPDEPYTTVSQYASGQMVAVNGENASFTLQARKPGNEYNDYTINYIESGDVTGKYEDNKEVNNTLQHDGLAIEIDGKNINIYIKEGVTQANDIKQLIENDPLTKNLFQIILTGTGEGYISTQDDTLVTEGGVKPPGTLSGAKLLGGLDADDFGMRFVSEGYGSDAKVEVIARKGTFELKDAYGNVTEKDYGKDIDALLNGVQMVARGLNVSINTSTIGLSFTFAEGTEAGYSTSFDIVGGGATFQLGPAVTTNQQITIGIQSLNTISLGGVSGKLYQLKSGQDADLSTNTRKAYKIVEESIVQVTSLRGRFGAIQRATFETNINVLNDTLEALTSAESQIRDTDFAAETSNMTRNQILVQSGIQALGLANQIPQYIMGLLQ
jgi:flagellin-like hook-associated protein FlgL